MRKNANTLRLRHAIFERSRFDRANALGAWTACRRVLRGGSWNDDPRYLRSAYRLRDTAGFRSNGFGLRVGRTLSP